MNLKRVDIFQAKTIRGAPKMPTELRYCIEVRLLRRRRQIADRHVLDHAAAKRADLSHRKTSCLRGGAAKNPRSSQTGGNYCDRPLTAAPAASFNPQNRFARKSPSKGQKPANSIYNSAMTARFLRAAAQRLEPRPRLRAAVQLASFWQFCSRYEKLIFIYTYACDSMPLLAEQSFRTARCLRKTAIRSYLSILGSVGSDLR